MDIRAGVGGGVEQGGAEVEHERAGEQSTRSGARASMSRGTLDGEAKRSWRECVRERQTTTIGTGGAGAYRETQGSSNMHRSGGEE